MNFRPLLRMATAFLFLPPVTAMPVRAQSITHPADLTSSRLESPVQSIPTPVEAATSTPVLDHQSLETFFAGLVPYALKSGDIAGAAIAVVEDGKLIFSKGYGYANENTRTPVIADRTLFRIGSASKLFTWTAVMQLVEAGRIDLDKDVNTYLDFKIPSKFGKPITMRDLMTHTPGFADVYRDLEVPSPKQLFPLRRYLIENMPQRIFPPGEVVAYSNYGAVLAGYIVQRVSGESFDHYVEEHILKPLGMTRSTFSQPLPAALQPDMSTGYVTASAGPVIPFEAFEASPAGAMSATATDMADFMIAQLQDGSYRGASILSPAAVKLMHSPQYQAAPGINGMDLGFYQENRNGLEIIGHGGDTLAFHSYLHLILGADVGIFLAFNSQGRNKAAEKARTEIYHRFLDTYFPGKTSEMKTVANAERDAERVAGWYVVSRRSELGLFFLFSQIRVSALPNGLICIKESTGTRQFREVARLSYREVHGQTQLTFVTAPNGRIRYWVLGSAPMVVFQPVRGLKQFGLVTSIGGLALAVFVLTLTIWIGGWAVRHHYRRPMAIGRRAYWMRLLSRIGIAAQLAVVLGWIVWFARLSNPTTMAYGVTESGPILICLYVLGVLAILGGIAIIVEALSRIRTGPGSIFCRTGEALLALSAAYAIWFNLAFGLASFNMHF
jgi:CubicO group peptidase (beta-lactamase class C family)